MKAVNIAIKFTEEINIYLEQINKLVPENKLVFDKDHLPHLTLLQFYTLESRIKEIKENLDKINITNLDDFRLSLENMINKVGENNVYFVNIISDNLIELQKEIKDTINKYIEYPTDKLEKHFIEEITYKQLPILVLNNSKFKYNPHITFAITKKEINLEINLFIETVNKIIINKDKIYLDIFEVGDNGTAIPFYKYYDMISS